MCSSKNQSPAYNNLGGRTDKVIPIHLRPMVSRQVLSQWHLVSKTLHSCKDMMQRNKTSKLPPRQKHGIVRHRLQRSRLTCGRIEIDSLHVVNGGPEALSIGWRNVRYVTISDGRNRSVPGRLRHWPTDRMPRRKWHAGPTPRARHSSSEICTDWSISWLVRVPHVTHNSRDDSFCLGQVQVSYVMYF